MHSKLKLCAPKNCALISVQNLFIQNYKRQDFCSLKSVLKFQQNLLLEMSGALCFHILFFILIKFLVIAVVIITLWLGSFAFQSWRHHQFQNWYCRIRKLSREVMEVIVTNKASLFWSRQMLVLNQSVHPPRSKCVCVCVCVYVCVCVSQTIIWW